MTSRVLSEEELILFSNAVSLSKAQQTEYLVGMRCIGEPTSTDFQVVFSVH